MQFNISKISKTRVKFSHIDEFNDKSEGLQFKVDSKRITKKLKARQENKRGQYSQIEENI